MPALLHIALHSSAKARRRKYHEANFGDATRTPASARALAARRLGALKDPAHMLEHRGHGELLDEW